MHRLQVERSISERFPFDHAGRGDGDVERVGAQPLFGDLKRRASSRARLEEQIDDGLATEGRDFLDRPLPYFFHCLGRVENERNLLWRQVGNAEQVLPPQGRQRGRLLDSRRDRCAHAAPPCCNTTSSRPSLSRRYTCTLSSREVGKFLPT